MKITTPITLTYSIITNEYDLNKENARIKQVLRRMDVRKALLVKHLREPLTITACLSHKTQTTDIQEKEIRISINSLYFEGNSEKLRRILKPYKIRSTFYIESTLRRLLCTPKDQGATEDKSKIVYVIDCSNCEAVFFVESKWSLKPRSEEHKSSVMNWCCEKNETAKHC